MPFFSIKSTEPKQIMNKHDVIIVGAGIAGLTAAIQLQKEGLNVKIIEASDRVGGRMKTDKVEGYLLDRGFQVLLTAYPETQNFLDYEALKLRNFNPGAKIFYNNKFYNFADPFRKPVDAFRGFNNPFSNFGDKLKVVALRNRSRRLSIEDIFAQKEKPTIDYLNEWNFSKKMIKGFFKPFLGGIFLEPDLLTSNRMFEFVFKMFGTGYAALPEQGMEAIPQQLAQKLAKDTILLNTRAVHITPENVMIDDGQTLEADAILIATDSTNIKKLLPTYTANTTNTGVRCLYFAADEPPFQEPYLVLNGSQNGWINNVAIPTNLQSSYAPEGKSLISVSIVRPTTLSESELYASVRKELCEWFGAAVVEKWMHLRTYVIPNALPAMSSINLPESKGIEAFEKGIFVCGDHVHDPSINGAMRSGRITAEAISWDLALVVNKVKA